MGALRAPQEFDEGVRDLSGVFDCSMVRQMVPVEPRVGIIELGNRVRIVEVEDVLDVAGAFESAPRRI